MAGRVLPRTDRYPDQFPEITKGTMTIPGSVDQKMADRFAPPQWPAGDYQQDSRLNIDARSLFSAQQGQVSVMSMTMNLQLQKLTGWHVNFATPTRVTTMTIEWRMKNAPVMALDRASEGVAPRYVVVNTESYSETLRRYNIGAIMSQDFYKTEAGREEAAIHAALVVSAAIVSCKLIVEQAIVRSKSFYRDEQRKTGIMFNGAREAFENEIRMFGACNFDENAIYKINADIEETVRRSNRTVSLNNFVVSPGTLVMLALGGKLETNALVRGADRANQVLQMNALAMQGALAGKIIFENPEWRVDNMSKSEYNALERKVTIGQAVIIDSSDHSKASKLASIAHNDLQADRLRVWTLEEALTQDLRFGPDGNQDPRLLEFAKNLANELEISKIGGIQDGLIDPHLVVLGGADTRARGSSTPSARINPNNIHPIKTWGSSHPAYYTYDQSLDAGRLAEKVINGHTDRFTADDRANIDDYIALSEELSSIPAQLTNTQAAAFKTYLGGIYTGLENVGIKGRTVPGNAYGSIDLPEDAEIPAGISKPWGYAGLNHFRYLASLVGSPRVQFRSYFERAAKIVKSIDRYTSILRVLYPHSELFNANYLPEHRRSGTRHFDRDTHAITNSLDKVRHPIWISPVGLSGGAAAINVGNRRANADYYVNLSDRIDAVIGTVHAVGQKPAFGAAIDDQIKDSTAEWLLTFTAANISAQLNEIYNNKIRDRISIPSFAAGTSTIADFYAAAVTDAGVGADQANSFIAALLSLLHFAAVHKGQPDVTVNTAYVESMRSGKDAGQIKASKKKSREAESLASQAAPADRLAFVNSRLIFDENLFIAAKSHDGLWAVIRPSNPQTGEVLNLPGGTAREKYADLARARHGPSGITGQLFQAKVPRNYDDDSIAAERAHIRPGDDTDDYTAPSGFDETERRYVTQDLITNKHGPFTTAGDGTGVVTANTFLIERVEYISEHLSSWGARVPALAYSLSRVTLGSQRAALDNGLAIAHGCKLKVFPFIHLTTQSLFAFSGSPGRLLWGFEDVNHQQDGSLKAWQLHYSIYLGCIIEKLDQLMIVRDINIVGYEGGLDGSVNTDPAQFDPANIDFKKVKSAWVFCVGANFSRNRFYAECNPLSLTGAYDNELLKNMKFRNGKNPGARTAQQWPSFLYYDYIWGFSRVNIGKTRGFNAHSFQTLKEVDRQSMLCWATRYHRYDEVKKRHTIVEEGTGHLKNAVCPMLPSLSGQFQYLTDKIET